MARNHNTIFLGLVQIATRLVNPNNLEPTLLDGGQKYFEKGPVTDAVPGLFLRLGALYAVLCLVAIVLIRNPVYQGLGGEEPEETQEEEEEEVGGLSSSGTDQSLRRQLYDGSDLDGRQASLLAEPQADSAVNFTPAQLVRSARAWHLSVALMLGALGGLITLGTYKTFGQETWSDDAFLSMVVGSLASIGNAT